MELHRPANAGDVIDRTLLYLAAPVLRHAWTERLRIKNEIPATESAFVKQPSVIPSQEEFHIRVRDSQP